MILCIQQEQIDKLGDIWIKPAQWYSNVFFAKYMAIQFTWGGALPLLKFGNLSVRNHKFD